MINILAICDEPEILIIFKILKLGLSIIRVVVPITLIVSLTLTYLSAVASKNEDLVRAAVNSSITKIVAAILVFFVPTFSQIIFNMATDDKTYNNCMANATEENISALYDARAEQAIKRAKEDIRTATYNEALSAVRYVSDGTKKSEYEKELEEIKSVIKIKEMIAKIKITKSLSQYQKASDAISKIKDDKLREELEASLEEAAATMNSYYGEYSSPGSIQNALGLPYYNQCDSRWGNIPYDVGGGSNGGPATFCSSSCGYTSLAMVVAGLSKDMSVTPVTMVEGLRKINISAGQMTYKGYGAASGSDLTNNTFLSKYGITGRSIGGGGGEQVFQKITSELNAGHPVIILVPGHYMVLSKGLNGGVVLLDPFTGWASPAKKSGEYSLQYIYNAYGGFNSVFAYSKGR